MLPRIQKNECRQGVMAFLELAPEPVDKDFFTTAADGKPPRS